MMPAEIVEESDMSFNCGHDPPARRLALGGEAGGSYIVQIGKRVYLETPVLCGRRSQEFTWFYYELPEGFADGEDISTFRVEVARGVGAPSSLAILDASGTKRFRAHYPCPREEVALVLDALCSETVHYVPASCDIVTGRYLFRSAARGDSRLAGRSA